MDMLHTATGFHSGDKTVGLVIGLQTPSATGDTSGGDAKSDRIKFCSIFRERQRGHKKSQKL